MQHANVSFNSKPSTKQIFECIQPSSNNMTKTPCEPFSHNSNQTDLVSSLLGAQPEVGDVDRLGKTSLGRGIKHLVERDVLEHFVHSQLVWVDHHRNTTILRGWNSQSGQISRSSKRNARELMIGGW